MPVFLRDLVHHVEFGALYHGSEDGLLREVQWVTTTGLLDPTPWLLGGELVIVSGLGLKSDREQTDLVRRMHDSDIAGIGFATSPNPAEFPKAAIDAALALGLPVLETPHHVPFIAIGRFVAERLTQEKYAHQERLMVAHDTLARALHTGQGLPNLVHALYGITEAPAAVIDLHGRILASYPRGAQWPVDSVIKHVKADSGVVESNHELQVGVISVDGYPTAVLCSKGGESKDIFPYAESFVGLELAKYHAVLSERRELAGQVIYDVVHKIISEKEAERRLAAFGIQLAEENAVIIGTVDCDMKRLHALLWTLNPLNDTSERNPVAAILDRQILVIIPFGKNVPEMAHRIFSLLADIAPRASVGFGGSYQGADGLRWSYLEARAGLPAERGVGARTKLDLPRMLLSNPQLPLLELAKQILSPLFGGDRQVDTDLIRTLRSFFLNNESASDVAEDLYIHRNSVRYRLRRIEELTGLSLESTQDKLQLWLAIMALDMANPGREATSH